MKNVKAWRTNRIGKLAKDPWMGNVLIGKQLRLPFVTDIVGEKMWKTTGWVWKKDRVQPFIPCGFLRTSSLLWRKRSAREWWRIQ